MRTLIITSLFIGGLFGMNSLPKQAKEQFANGKYQEAIRLFDEAIATYPGQRATLEFNIGQAWLLQDSAQRAINWYSRAASNKLDGFIASLAYNNLGVLWDQQQSAPPTPQPDPAMNQGNPAQSGDPLQAELDKVNRSLEAFKNALRRHTDNDFARYNYELLKRKQQQLQQQQQQQQQNQDQQKDKQEQQKEEKDNSQQNKSQKQQKSPQNTEGKGMEGQQQPVSMEEARQLLEAMKDNEKRFLQQLQKSKKHRPNRQDGPDW